MLLRKIKMVVTLCVFRGSSISGALKMVRKYDLKRAMNKDIVYGALMELSQNKQVWHESTVGAEYSHLTEEGKDAIIHVIEEMFRGLQTIHKQEITEEAKRQTLAALK